MNKKTKANTDLMFFLRNQSGVALVLVAILIVTFLGFAALAVDLGYIYVARNELQNATDAGALAGARKLGDNYINDPSHLEAGVQTQAETYASNNKVTNQTLDSSNLVTEIKCWNSTTLAFDNCVSGVTPNAVKVTASRATGMTSGAINTFFANIWNINTVDKDASAIAALGGPCTAKATVPIGIADGWFEGKTNPADCGGEFGLGAVPNQCAAWTTLSSTLQVNDGNQSMNIRDLLANPDKIPEASAGDWDYFDNGVKTSLLSDLNDKVVASGGELHVFIPVFKASCGIPYNQKYEIVGWATATITSVNLTSPKGFTARVDCTAKNAKGACTNYFTLGSIPGLVQ